MNHNEERRYTVAALALLAVLGAFRLWLATRYFLCPDECYYWLWSRFPDWCYYSKGPLVGWTIYIGTLLGGHTELGVRLPAVALHVATGWMIFLFAKKLFGARAAFWTVATAMCVPLFAVGSVLMTIDPLSVFFWTAAMLAGWHAFRDNSWGAWLMVGLMVGLGFLAKFTNAIQGLCFGLFLLSTQKGRMQLKTPQPWVALVIALALTLPFWIWNAQHDWITFSHLEKRGSLDKPFQISIGHFLTFIGLQAVVYSPLIWLGVMASIFIGIKNFRRQGGFMKKILAGGFSSGDEKTLYLLAQSVPLLLFFAVFALNNAGQPNWTVPGYIAALVLAASSWLKKMEDSVFCRRYVWAALGLSVFMTVALHETSWMGLPPNVDPLTRLRGWRKMGELVESKRQEHRASFLIANHWGLASALAYYIPGDRTRNFVFMERDPDRVQNQFDFWESYGGRLGEDAIYVTSHDDPPGHLPRQFESVRPLGPRFWFEDGGMRIMQLQFYLCKNFKGWPQKSCESK